MNVRNATLYPRGLAPKHRFKDSRHKNGTNAITSHGFRMLIQRTNVDSGSNTLWTLCAVGERVHVCIRVRAMQRNS